MRRGETAKKVSRTRVRSMQAALLVGFLLAWQYLPTIDFLRDRWPVFDPFFVSSPSQVARALVDLFSQSGYNGLSIFDYIWTTLAAFAWGTLIGVVLGMLAGLVLSNSPTLDLVLRPFIVAMNAVPRIALIPIVVIIFGPTFRSSVATSVMVVTFVVFFNAYEGGKSVPQATVDNVRLHGATRLSTMRHVRAPYVLAWTFASLPNAVTFGLLSVVTAEILTGYAGIGRLLTQSVATVNSTLTFALVVILGVIGVVLVSTSDLVRRRLLHWWDAA